MILTLSLLCIILAVILIASFHKCAGLSKALKSALNDLEVADGRFAAEKSEIVTRTQSLIDQHLAECKAECERIRHHYEQEAQKSYNESQAELAKLRSLRKYEALYQEEEEARQQLSTALREAALVREQAAKVIDEAKCRAAEEQKEALLKIRELGRQGEAVIAQARLDAAKIIDAARKRAETMAGDAYTALQEKRFLEEALQSIRNAVGGYGDRYVVPTHSILDELAANFSHTAAGESLRTAREHSRNMVTQGTAATCDYAEASRRETAIRFVIDAFNGRVDAILSRTKEDNLGTLETEIRDAFNLVNLNGEAFRNARILPDYLDARLSELKYAVIVQELRQREREEQRRIQEQIREEEKARRDYERAMREAAKEEDTLKKAIEKAELLVQQATAEQKHRHERQLQELAEKLKLAEEKNQRAVSMAQQTRRGHVYIVSNIGSLGENVYKIGLTRRLDPLERIRELGDSSVPFEFDVHAMIFSEDAPALELQLHNHFLLAQVNKVNHRKEFFKVDLKHIREELEKLGLTTKWTMTAAAAEYRETLTIEKMIKDDPKKREAWIKRQLELEVVQPLNPEIDSPSAPDVSPDALNARVERSVQPANLPMESF
jgi:hypothetical protein